jgi:hypothetical protein
MRNLLLSLVFLVPLAAFGQVYKWVDEKGVVHYTDKPPSPNATPAKLPELQTFRSPVIAAPDAPADRTDAATPPAPAGTARVRIESPADDATVRSIELPVSVSVTPGLAEGQRLVYYLDGSARTLPTTSTSVTLSAIGRGTHQITVSLVDGAGREIRRSAPVTVHFMPPGTGNQTFPGTQKAPALPRTPGTP